jgi:hypothetical protein
VFTVPLFPLSQKNSCKSSNPGYPDSDKIKLDITKKLCYYRTICPTLTFRKKIDRRNAIEEGKRERKEKGKRVKVQRIKESLRRKLLTETQGC